MVIVVPLKYNIDATAGLCARATACFAMCIVYLCPLKTREEMAQSKSAASFLCLVYLTNISACIFNLPYRYLDIRFQMYQAFWACIVIMELDASLWLSV